MPDADWSEWAIALNPWWCDVCGRWVAIPPADHVHDKEKTP